MNGGRGVEARLALVRNHHLQSVLAVLLAIQRHPVDDLTWRGDQSVRAHPGNGDTPQEGRVAMVIDLSWH